MLQVARGAGLFDLLSYLVSVQPEFFHKIETMGNHVVELVLPALLLFPHRYARMLGGLAQIGFQVRKYFNMTFLVCYSASVAMSYCT
jgi:hypothetical protein